jgi:hypothetical protein
MVDWKAEDAWRSANGTAVTGPRRVLMGPCPDLACTGLFCTGLACTGLAYTASTPHRLRQRHRSGGGAGCCC